MAKEDVYEEKTHLSELTYVAGKLRSGTKLETRACKKEHKWSGLTA